MANVTLSVLFEWIGEANRRLDAGERFGAGALRDMLWAIGLDNLLDEPAERPDAEAQTRARQLFARLAPGAYYKPLGGSWMRK